ncbi:PRC-barrel domain-containing protein [Agromyces bauzanensis]
MILTDLLGTEAFDADGRRLGRVVDARLEISGAPARSSRTPNWWDS